MATPSFEGWTCPLPLQSYPTIVMGHGAGGKMMSDLIHHLFAAELASTLLTDFADAATIQLDDSRLAFTTDSFVVSPLFFPGGNIGELAVNGTINDLAAVGARPAFLSAAFILEEGLPMATLAEITHAMRRASEKAGVQIATGDTKVVNRGHGDGAYINTSGIGLIPKGVNIGPRRAKPGDVVMISGSIGDHGIAVMSVREGLSFQAEIRSDTAPLAGMVQSMIEANSEIHCLRDLTRGGLSSALNEIAGARGVGIRVDEAAIPVEEGVKGACEILGLDPLYVANEGRFTVLLPEAQAERAIGILREFEVSSRAVRIGVVEESDRGTVILRSRVGGNRVLDMLSGEQLPRIC